MSTREHVLEIVRAVFLILGIALAAFSLAACSARVVSPGQPVVVGGALLVGVDTGVTPFYNWQGGNAGTVRVYRANSLNKAVWDLESTTRDTLGRSVAVIASPERQGSVPAGATAVTIDGVFAEPVLSYGVRYRTVVTRYDGVTGYVEFTPGQI